MMLSELVITEADRVASSGDMNCYDVQLPNESNEDATQDSCEDASPAKVPRLQAKYQKIRQQSSTSERATPRMELAQFLIDTDYQAMEAAKFWSMEGPGKEKYPSLFKVAKRIFNVPASSAPVERIFSQGGLIMRPLRARLSENMLKTLMFLKCNENVL